MQKFVAKSRTGGYDGKGVAILNTASLEAGIEHIPFKGPTVIEAFVPCEKELSVIVARDAKGNMVTYPLVEMVFDPNANLVDTLLSPAQVNDSIAAQAREIALQTIQHFNVPGLFAVEMFLDKDHNLYVNEIAPRPHNSGHHTIEACYTSQYEQLLRILTGLPLGSTEQLQPAAMINILGAADVNGSYRLGGIETVMDIPGVYIHMYRKRETKPMRKLGHATILGTSVDEVLKKVDVIRHHLRIIPD